METLMEYTMNEDSDGKLILAEKVRKACIDAAREEYLDAAMSGICSEGALEAAVGAIQSLSLEEVLEQ